MKSTTQERSIEFKVGAVILVSLGIIAAFVLVLGGLQFERTYPVFVDFDNPGGIHAGAPVRIAGVRVGTVSDLEFHAGKFDPNANRHVLVRARVSIYKK